MELTNFYLSSIVNSLVSLSFYVNVILTIRDKNKEHDIINLLYTFLTLYTLSSEIVSNYNKINEDKIQYIPILILLIIDIIMTIILTVFVHMDFSKMTLLRYYDHPYYKIMLYITYFMIVVNITLLFYSLYKVYKSQD